MNDNQQQTASLGAFLDAKGQPAAPPTFDSPPVWSIDNAVAVLTPSADGTSCLLVASAVGSGNLSVVGMVGGVQLACPAIAVVVSAGPAASMSISLSAPVSQ